MFLVNEFLGKIFIWIQGEFCEGSGMEGQVEFRRYEELVYGVGEVFRVGMERDRGVKRNFWGFIVDGDFENQFCIIVCVIIYILYLIKFQGYLLFVKKILWNWICFGRFGKVVSFLFCLSFVVLFFILKWWLKIITFILILNLEVIEVSQVVCV